MAIRLKNPAEIESMRRSGKILADVLDLMEKQAVVGITPKELAAAAAAHLKEVGAKPSFLGFHGYPEVICISVNDQVQHSIPDKRPLEEGDVVNFDFGVTYEGMITDSGRTVIIGEAKNSRDLELVRGTKEALDAAAVILKPGIKIGDISATIEKVLKKYRLGIVRELVGHGVGFELHEDPEIPNYGKAGRGVALQPNMTIAIEPIAISGSADIYMDRDGWTIRSWDGSNSAQFEHTFLITEHGSEILTTNK